MTLMKANHTDRSNLLIPDNDTVSKHDKKLAMARSLVVNMTELGENETNSYRTERLTSREERCRIILDYINDLYLTVLPFNDAISVHICHLTESNSSHFATMKGITFFK